MKVDHCGIRNLRAQWYTSDDLDGLVHMSQLGGVRMSMRKVQNIPALSSCRYSKAKKVFAAIFGSICIHASSTARFLLDECHTDLSCPEEDY